MARRDPAGMVVQGADVRLIASVDYVLPPDEVAVIVQAADARFTHWVDYDAPLWFGNTVTLSDELLLQLTAHLVIDDAVSVVDAMLASALLSLSISDNVTLSDALTTWLGRLDLADTLTVSDSGVIGFYDYASADYFETPLDYVGNTRTF